MRFGAPLLILCACAEERGFIAWPELDPGTQSVAIAFECSGTLTVSLEPREAAFATPLLIETCQDPVVTVLEYAETPEVFGLSYGRLEPAAAFVCGVLPLPPALRTHRTRLEDPESSRFEPLPAGAPRPGALEAFRTQQTCVCRNLRLAGLLEFPSASWYHVESIGPNRALVFSTLGDRIDVHHTDLETVELVHSATIALAPEGQINGVARGLNDVTAEPPGVFFLAGDLGEIHVFRESEGLELFATLPEGHKANLLAASSDPTAPELYVLTTESALFRYAQGTWFEFRLEPTIPIEASQRAGLAWLAPGRVAVTPANDGQIAFTQGDRLTSVPWTELGSIHAVANVPNLGLIVGTRRTTMFRVNADEPGEWEELLGPNRQSIEPTRSWFQQIRPSPYGFVASLDGPHSLLSFDERWGYCPQQPLTGFNVQFERFGVVGDRILVGGYRSTDAPTDGPLMLPVLEPQPGGPD